MVNQVTLNLTDNNGKKTGEFTMLTQNKNFINCVITVGEENTITETQMNELQSIAKRAGDKGVLEQCDLNSSQKLNLANMNDFDEYYDINISKDGKYFEVKIKDAGLFVKNPSLDTIKSDFGIRDNVFVTKGGIPHGNESIIEKRGPRLGANDKNLDYDRTTLEVGDVLRIPVNEINITDSPRGFWGRLFQLD